jgi:hypothetical protein
MEPFQVGQTWAYHTRPGEESSRIIVLRVDETTHAGIIVHIAVEGVRLPGATASDRTTQAIGFAPIAHDALVRSVTELVGTEPDFIPPSDFEEGYRGWRSAFDAGKAGIWTTEVATIVQTLDDGMRMHAEQTE